MINGMMKKLLSSHNKINKAYVVSATLLCAILAMTACVGGSGSLGRTYQGSVLAVTLFQMEYLPDLGYFDRENDTHYLISPSSNTTELVLIGTRVDNVTATTAGIDLEDGPAELRTDDGAHWRSIDISKRQSVLETAHPKEDSHLPLNLGYFDLPRGQSLEFWMIFDVPKGAVIESFKWDGGGDVVIIEF